MIVALVRAVGLILVGLVFIAAPMAALKLGVWPHIDNTLESNGLPPPIVHPIAMLIAMVLGYWAFVRLIERRAATELVLRPVQALGAVALAICLIGGPMLALYITGYFRLLSFVGFGATWSAALTILAAAALEELAFRGVIFGVLERHVGTLSALLGQSLLFGVVHMSNAGFTTPIDLMAVILIGGLWTLLYATWRSIWSITLHHAVWNLTIVVSGLTLSGIDDFREAAVFRSDIDGPRLITGGDAGPESSIITLAVVFAALVVAWWLAERRDASRANASA